MKRALLIALFILALLLVLYGWFMSNVALVSGEYREALNFGMALVVVGDAIFVIVSILGSRPWRIASAIGALPSLWVLIDFLTRGR